MPLLPGAGRSSLDGQPRLPWQSDQALLKDGIASALVAQMLYLDSEDSSKPIHLYITSPGGSVTAGLVRPDICLLSGDFAPPLSHRCALQRA